jgi:hypothetical protein
MISSILALFLFATPAQAAWNLDSNYAVSPGMNQEGFAVDLNWNTAISPFAKGPQLETNFSSNLGSAKDLHRFGLGVRQELGANLAASAHVLIASYDGISRPGAEGAVSWKFWRPQNPEIGMGLGLYAYGGIAPEQDEAWWWAGTGLQMSFGR